MANLGGGVWLILGEEWRLERCAWYFHSPSKLEGVPAGRGRVSRPRLHTFLSAHTSPFAHTPPFTHTPPSALRASPSPSLGEEFEMANFRGGVEVPKLPL